MKPLLILFTLCFSICLVSAQPAKKAGSKEKSPSQAEINKMMEDAMNKEGMSKEEKEQMKKMMQGVMPALQETNRTMADYPEFSNNRMLIPVKNSVAISNASKKVLAASDIANYANTLYAKIVSKGDAAEIALLKKITVQTPSAADLSAASLLALLQGHPQTALGLSIKAAASDPGNRNLQNNMAALLTNYGFAEQSLPILRKLQDELPLNSTVLNNVGQAWLQLGETDSAKRYFSFAFRVNPLHPEAKLCGGLMNELKGDPIKAEEEYIESMESAPNMFTESILKHKNSNYQFGDLDLKKLLSSLTVYEYFPKGWMPEPPTFSNDVHNFTSDNAIKIGYLKMVQDMNEKIQVLNDELGKDLDNVFKKGEDQFVKEMTNETFKGLSVMSRPATIIVGMLTLCEKKWYEDYAKEIVDLGDWKSKLYADKQKQIDAIYKIMGDNQEDCSKYKARLNTLENEYMTAVNTRTRKFLIDKTEEFRQWVNAIATWNWYIAGNIKNVILMQDIGFTGLLTEMYSSIVTSMEVLNMHCDPLPDDEIKAVETPEIPNFTCPAVVSIPAGPGWQKLMSSTKDFNANSYNISKTTTPVPNVSIAVGTGKMLAQPGLTPFYKTGNGDITPGNADVDAAMDKGLLAAFRKVNGTPKTTDEKVDAAIDKGLGDAMKRMQERRKQGVLGDDDELVPLPKLTPDELTPLDPKLLNKYKLFKDLMNKMLTSSCKDVKSEKENLKAQLDRMMKKVKELDAYENVMDQIKQLENQVAQKEMEAQKKEALKNKIDAFQKSVDELDNYEQMQDFLKKAEQFGKEMDAMDEKQAFKASTQKIMQLIDEMESTPAIINEIKQNGVQTSISSGLQAPGTFNLPKDLFK